MAALELDHPKKHLIAAFLAMEPPHCLISLARKCGGDGGSVITEDVQAFIWDHCINNTNDEKRHVPYLKSFLKKLIVEVESTGGTVLDEFYERYAYYMATLKENEPAKAESWIVKYISFLFDEVPRYSGPTEIVVPLHSSLNMLQGDTGCALWPSGLFLSEFILSSPGIFAGKSCLEVGSGVGLLGICLQHVKASKVILTDGDASSLANLKLNLEMNRISYKDTSLDKSMSDADVVQCYHLPWESAKESEIQQFMPDIVLGADVIYDPSCLPHLIRVLSILLDRREAMNHKLNGDTRVQGPLSSQRSRIRDLDVDNQEIDSLAAMNILSQELEFGPVALIASVIRNIDTFNCFLSLSRQAKLVVKDLTKAIKPFSLLPYMDSYARSDVHLFVVSHLHNFGGLS